MAQDGPRCPIAIGLRSRRRRPWFELYLQWAERRGWLEPDIGNGDGPACPGRSVRLAAVHFPAARRWHAGRELRLYAPLIAEAARQKAISSYLGESVTYYGLERSIADVAEPYRVRPRSISAA